MIAIPPDVLKRNMYISHGKYMVINENNYEVS